MEKPRNIVLLGASVGRDWKIEELPSRLNIQKYQFEYVGEYQFDKTKPLQEMLQRKENKPDAIVIKECAAYFPGDLSQYQALMESWIEKCKESKVIPIPTTVVPVVRAGFSDVKLKLKETIKWVLGRPTLHLRLQGLVKYNEWIRSYGQKEGLLILDLEAALRVSESDRSLKKEFHSGDGLHLNEKAYAILDQIVFPTLDQAFKINQIK